MVLVFIVHSKNSFWNVLIKDKAMVMIICYLIVTVPPCTLFQNNSMLIMRPRVLNSSDVCCIVSSCFDDVICLWIGWKIFHTCFATLSTIVWLLIILHLNFVTQNFQNVVPQVDDDGNSVHIFFTPTIPHCSMATLIGLSIRVKLLRSLPARFKVNYKLRL